MSFGLPGRMQMADYFLVNYARLEHGFIFLTANYFIAAGVPFVLTDFGRPIKRRTLFLSLLGALGCIALGEFVAAVYHVIDNGDTLTPNFVSVIVTAVYALTFSRVRMPVKLMRAASYVGITSLVICTTSSLGGVLGSEYHYLQWVIIAAFQSTGLDKENNYTDGGLYVGNWLVAVENDAMTSFTVRDGTIGVADGKSDTSLFPTSAQKNVDELTLPESLKYIGSRSFARLLKITDLNLPSDLLTLGDSAFAGCYYLKTVNLGDCSGLESIGEKAFSEAAISEITIPEKVVSVGELVFNQNSVDLTIRCEVSERPVSWDENWSYSLKSGVNIKVEWKNA